MIRRILFQFLLGSIIQLIFYVGLLYLAKLVLDLTINDPRILMDRHGILLSASLGTSIFSVQNLLTAIINRKWFTWTGIVIVLILYSMGWGEDFSAWPERTVIHLLIGFAVILGKTRLDTALMNIGKNITATNNA